LARFGFFWGHAGSNSKEARLCTRFLSGLSVVMQDIWRGFSAMAGTFAMHIQSSLLLSVPNNAFSEKLKELDSMIVQIKK